MDIEIIQADGVQIAAVNNITITNTEDALDILGNVYYQGFDKVIISAGDITPDFFDLKTGVAGEILQKFTNYRVRLVIVGDFTKYESHSLRDFIFESNKHTQINFVATREEAVARLMK